MFDDNCFKEFLSIHEEGAGILINSTNVKEHIRNTAIDIKRIIRSDVKNKMVSIQTDTASRHGRSFLTVNLQYYSNIERQLVVRTLGVVELNNRHTANYINLEIGRLLDEYGIDKTLVIAFVCDNGYNLIAAGKRFKEFQNSLLLNEELEELRAKLCDEYEDEFSGDHDADVVESESTQLPTSIQNALSQITSLAVIVRCSVHSLQLAVNNSLDKMDKANRLKLDNVRKFVKTIKSSSFASERVKYHIPKIPIDVKTRWNSTFLMISKILEVEGNLIKMFDELDEAKKTEIILLASDFEFMKSYKEAFEPAYQLTLKLQLVQTSMGN